MSEEKMSEHRDHLARERTKLANERTFLSYVRTALSLLVLGIASLHFFKTDSIAVAFGMFVLTIGVLVLVIGFVRFWSKRQSITKL